MHANLLSHEDIARLSARHSAEDQAEVIEKIAAHYIADGAGSFSEKESEIANGIFQLLMQQAETHVRATLALHLSKTSKIPLDLARQMANDVPEVATPILESSPMLTEEELIAIVMVSRDALRLEAIARRETLSETLSDALVDTHIPSVVTTVVRNDGAQISTATFEKIVDRHAEDLSVMGAFCERAALPPDIVERVMERVSGPLKQQLADKFSTLMDREHIQKTIDQTLELTSLKMMGLRMEESELMRVIDYLDGQNKLTPFSALAAGNLQLFEITLSRMAHQPITQIQQALKEVGGLARLFERAELPMFLLQASELTVSVIRQLEAKGMSTGMKRSITPHELLSHLEGEAYREDIEGMEYIYAMIHQAVRKHAHNAGY